MSKPNLFPFFKLSILRIADLQSGSRSLGTYRSLVRQCAEPFGLRQDVEIADEQILAAIELLWKDGCINHDKLVNGVGWVKYTDKMDMWDFVNRNGSRIALTAKGRELLAEMESQIVDSEPAIKPKAIGFHAA